MRNIHKGKKISITQIVWGRIAHNFTEMMPGWLSYTLPKMVMISYIVCETWQKLFINIHKNHILYGCNGNKYGPKNLYLSKIMFSFADAFKRISELFFTKFGRHIWSDTPAHKGWNTFRTWVQDMITSSNGNNYRVCVGNTPVSTKASDGELWCFLWSAPK